MTDLKIDIDGNFDSFEDQLKALVEQFNNELQKSGGRMTQDLEAFARRIQDLQSSYSTERKRNIENDYDYNRRSGMSRPDAREARDSDMRMLGLDLEQEQSLLSQIRDSIREGNSEQQQQAINSRRTLNSLAQVFAVRQMVSGAAEYVDRRASLNADSYGQTPGSNIADAVMYGAGTGMMIGGPWGALAGVLAGAVTLGLKTYSQKDAAELDFAKGVVRSSNSLARYGGGAFGQQGSLLDYRSNRYTGNMLDAVSMGVGPAEFYSRLEKMGMSGGIQGGTAGILSRTSRSLALEKGYGLNIDFGIQKVLKGDLVDVNLQMLNKLATISDKSGISASNLILANQKSAELGRILGSQASVRGTANGDLAAQQMYALQTLMPTGSAEGISQLYNTINEGAFGQKGGGMRVLQLRAMMKTMMRKGQGIGDFGLIQRNLDLGLAGGLGNEYVGELNQSLKGASATSGQEYLLFKALYGANPYFTDQIRNNPKVMSRNSRGGSGITTELAGLKGTQYTDAEPKAKAEAEMKMAIEELDTILKGTNYFLSEINKRLVKAVEEGRPIPVYLEPKY